MDTFWINKPSILLKHDNLKYFWPNNHMTSYEKLNAITRLVLYLTVLSTLVLDDKMKFMMIGLITLTVIVGLYYINYKNNSKENELIEQFNNNIKSNNWTMPTPKNPAMNVMLPEILDNPTRKSAAPVTKEINEKIDDAAKKYIVSNYKSGDKELQDKIYRDLGDSLNFKNSMRAWYPTANTQIPSNDKEFKNFLVGDTGYCKKEYNFCSNS